MNTQQFETGLIILLFINIIILSIDYRRKINQLKRSLDTSESLLSILEEWKTLYKDADARNNSLVNKLKESFNTNEELHKKLHYAKDENDKLNYQITNLKRKF